MGLLTKEVTVLPVGRSIKHYRQLGYDAQYRIPLTVSVEHLPDGSMTKVDVICDYCGKHFQQTWSTYKRGMNKPVKKVCCWNCKPLKEHEDCDITQNGVWSNQTEEAKRKKDETMLKKYGDTNASRVPALIEKRNQTVKNKWGYENIWDVPEIQEQRRKTIKDKYGVDSIWQSPEIKEKIAQTYYQNGSGKTSTQQLYLYNLLGGELNYPCSLFNIDIYINDSTNKLAIEYNGSGHDAAVKMYFYTQSQFTQKEVYRCKVLKENGYKRIDIDSNKDFLPYDEKILEMIEFAKQFFIDNPNRSWIKFSIDQSKIYSNSFKDGIPYDFGELRKIKKEIIAS